MQITVSGHHLDITDAIKESVEKKLEKISSRFSSITVLRVILSVENSNHVAEIAGHYLHHDFSVTAKNQVLYPAIDKAVAKLNKHLASKKGASQAQRKQTIDVADEDSGSEIDEEDTFVE
jgi:putative sigma-54 modulation protein